MRQIMMLFEVVQKILRHRKKGETKPALDQVKYFYQTLKIDKNVESLGIEELFEFLEKDKNLTNEQIEMVAFVLKEQGELESNKEQGLDYFRKSYFLLKKVERESITFSMDRQMKISELREYLN
ncbi:MAG: hypothetical protein HN778_13800 [Prolixibacteraceae bacterium]|nr:hypothetical protein [Prolixibacteraceae bacterium]MBT6763993.1 hypothetical protein [Prolixibacteraceae bacterium]MBT6999510.1 hypothetical protein [Prolixibacteraceae bacterium]MBT7395900.1 hypothetical protein [Prolixibacteraceae bacterium]